MSKTQGWLATGLLACTTLSAQQVQQQAVPIQALPQQVRQSQQVGTPKSQQQAAPRPVAATPAAVPGKATAEQQAEITRLIDQLVFVSGAAPNQPVLSPGVRDNSDEYRARFTACQKAYSQLAALGEVAFPQLIEHFEDKRESINFRNHYIEHAVGDACYWIVFGQLQDRPANYSEYGYSRKGRDGQDHPKPYWSGSPFDKAGGLKPWLEQHKALSLRQKQVVCLSWLLQGEKAIGASDAESYYTNILPLEIRILEHRVALGEKLEDHLNYWQRVQKEKLDQAIPREMLPAR